MAVAAELPQGLPAGFLGEAFRLFLRVPLFHKVLWGNVTVVVLVMAVGGWVLVGGGRTADVTSLAGLAALLAGVGVGLSLLVNMVLLRLALRPLREIHDVAARVRDREAEARVPVSVITDRDLERLAEALNGLLDSLASYRERVHQVAARALGTAEEERKRIARELHDETAQRLAALLIRLRLARRTTDLERRDLFLDEIREGLTEILEGVRRFARGLRPPALDELGLAAAVASYAREMSEASRLTVEVGKNELPCELDAETELALYRIVQEALSNVSRHSGASSARVELRAEAGVVVAKVSDDGRGFRLAEAIGAGGALGLMGMQERAGYLGGRVSIESNVGSGTCVTAKIPVGSGSGG